MYICIRNIGGAYMHLFILHLETLYLNYFDAQINLHQIEICRYDCSAA
jgi:hypothetical protein